jgi:hypothetical protein
MVVEIVAKIKLSNLTWLARSLEERFVDCAARPVRRANEKEKAAPLGMGGCGRCANDRVMSPLWADGWVE